MSDVTPWSEVLQLLGGATGETLYMVGVSTLLAVLGGLPLGVLLHLTSPVGLNPRPVLYRVLGVVVDVVRSVPFVVLLVILASFTRLLIGTSIGSTAVIVPLTIGAVPFFARLTQNALREVSFTVVEAAITTGSSRLRIVWTVLLGEARAALVGAVGQDFDEYRSWLERHGVDTASVHVSATKHTSRFLCTTDQDFNQIASFYPGAMNEAREIELKSVADRLGGLDYVVISANDPDAMVRHTEECRQRGYKFVADPGQQLARMDGDSVRKLVQGAEFLFTNEYEHGLLLQSTGWSHDEVLAQVGSWVTSLGAKGLKVESANGPTLEVTPPKEKQKGDPTGVGDALRAGFLAGLHHELDLERSLQLGCTLATVSLETDGPQEYDIERESFLARIAEAYGDAAASEVGSKLR